jgi:hypothetical protein
MHHQQAGSPPPARGVVSWACSDWACSPASAVMVGSVDWIKYKEES